MTAALPQKADIKLKLGKRSASDPKRTLLTAYELLDSVNQLEKLSVCTRLKGLQRQNQTRGKTGTEEEPLPNSVAVLPLENLSPNPDDAYYRADTHEGILTRFAKIKDLNVIARASMVVE